MGALDCAAAAEVVATMATTPSATIEVRMDRLVEDAVPIPCCIKARTVPGATETPSGAGATC